MIEPAVRRCFDFPLELIKEKTRLTSRYHVCACLGALYVSTANRETAFYALGLGLKHVAARELALAKGESVILLHPSGYAEEETFFDERRGRATLGIVSGEGGEGGRRHNAVSIVELDTLCRGAKIVCVLDEHVALRHNPWLRAMPEPHRSMH